MKLLLLKCLFHRHARAKMQFIPAGHGKLTMGVEKTGLRFAGTPFTVAIEGCKYRVRGSGLGKNEIQKDSTRDFRDVTSRAYGDGR